MKLLIRLFFILFFLTLVLSGGLWAWNRITVFFNGSQPAAEEQKENTGEKPDFVKGFSQDKDGDGLSDAKEQIFGSDPNNPDTDGDTFRDGDEVEKGYDPTVTGSARLKDNPRFNDNITWQYFEWGRETLDDKDITLDENKIVQFFEARGIAKLKLPETPDNEVKKSNGSGKEAIKAYLEALAAIRPPAETGSFPDLAENVIETKNTDRLDKVIAGLIATSRQYAALSPPNEAAALHKHYISMLKALQNLFADLYTIGRDPVKLMRDIRWGNDLIGYATEIEKQRVELAKQITE